ncbi:MAG: radical SAM protein [Cyclobacteriaceae bacterium]
MPIEVLLITPPFTQLNTPYPATAYIKGFLKTIGTSSFQCDLGIEIILKLFSKKQLAQIFAVQPKKCSKNSSRIYALRADYIESINPVIRFLQNKNPTLAYQISQEDFLPRASRFDQLDELEWAFGTMGIHDKARYLSTLYLEDLGDYIKENVDAHFGFSRYAERLGMSATTFDDLNDHLAKPLGMIDLISVELLESYILKYNPAVIGLSVPFPGNLFGALRIGQFVKEHYPSIKVIMGGGYPNTELRSLSDPRIFNYIDFITLDDGERPLVCLLEYLEGKRNVNDLKRTFILEDGSVYYSNGDKDSDISYSDSGTPNYEGLKLTEYLSVIEVTNPMHRLWSDGRWNKLTMAHGCYWKKCSFCDISLDYIRNYQPVSAEMLCDRMEEMIDQTGETGFHFVDEAAPPALMRELALEILKRKLAVTWWTNIRFEERFTADLCVLLKSSGCIAVSGGLEVASDRLLEKMKKGISVARVARVSRNFTDAGIMVHAYLMYGFPTQTAQETIDSLEMVRQLFYHGVVQSGFWHLFAMTAHSPVGLNPEDFGVKKVGPSLGTFANNDLIHDDPDGAEHELFGEGLRKALFNYMHGLCFDYDLQEWFDFQVPKTSINPFEIEIALAQKDSSIVKGNKLVVWNSSLPEKRVFKTKKKKPMLALTFQSKLGEIEISAPLDEGQWWYDHFGLFEVDSRSTYESIDRKFETLFGKSIVKSQVWRALKKEGLLVV